MVLSVILVITLLLCERAGSLSQFCFILLARLISDSVLLYIADHLEQGQSVFDAELQFSDCIKSPHCHRATPLESLSYINNLHYQGKLYRVI